MCPRWAHPRKEKRMDMSVLFEYRRDEKGESMECYGLTISETVAHCLQPICLLYHNLCKQSPKVADKVRRMVVSAVMDPHYPLFDDSGYKGATDAVDVCIFTPNSKGKREIKERRAGGRDGTTDN